MQERLQKFLANSGLGSRRYCESLIKEGKILVNGKVAELGSKVGLSDEIFYEGKVISRTKSDLKVILLNKPEGVLSSNLKEKNDPTPYFVISIYFKIIDYLCSIFIYLPFIFFKFLYIFKIHLINLIKLSVFRIIFLIVALFYSFC